MTPTRAVLVFLLAYAVLATAGFLRNIGRPARHGDVDVARFLVAQGWADLATNGVLLAALVQALHGRVAVWLYATALVVQGGVYTWRWWITRRGARSRKTDIANTRGKVGNMRFKISPEMIRLIAIVAAGVQAFTAVLTGTDVVSSKVLVIIVAAGAFLQATAAAYSQGVQTNPPEGMLTEERARELSVAAAPPAGTTPEGWRAPVPPEREPVAEWTPDTRPAAGD